MATGTHPEGVIEGVVEAIMFAATVLALHAAAATQNVTLVTLTAFSTRVGAVKWGGEVRAGGWAGTGAHFVMAEFWT